MKKTASIALTLIFAVSLVSGAFAGGRGHIGSGHDHNQGQTHTPGQYHQGN